MSCLREDRADPVLGRADMAAAVASSVRSQVPVARAARVVAEEKVAKKVSNL